MPELVLLLYFLTVFRTHLLCDTLLYFLDSVIRDTQASAANLSIRDFVLVFA